MLPGRAVLGRDLSGAIQPAQEREASALALAEEVAVLVIARAQGAQGILRMEPR
jgi:hypothetical protein